MTSILPTAIFSLCALPGQFQPTREGTEETNCRTAAQLLNFLHVKKKNEVVDKHFQIALLTFCRIVPLHCVALNNFVSFIIQFYAIISILDNVFLVISVQLIIKNL